MYHYLSAPTRFPVQKRERFPRLQIGYYSPYYGRTKGRTLSAESEWKHYSNSLTLYPMASGSWKGQGKRGLIAQWPAFAKCAAYCKALSVPRYGLYWRSAQWECAWDIAADIRAFLTATHQNLRYYPALGADDAHYLNLGLHETGPAARAYAARLISQAKLLFEALGERGQYHYPELREAKHAFSQRYGFTGKATVYWPDWAPPRLSTPAGAPWREGAVITPGAAAIISASSSAKRDNQHTGTGQWQPSIIADDNKAQTELIAIAWECVEKLMNYYNRFENRQAFADLLLEYTHFYALLGAIEHPAMRKAQYIQGQLQYMTIVERSPAAVQKVAKALWERIARNIPDDMDIEYTKKPAYGTKYNYRLNKLQGKNRMAAIKTAAAKLQLVKAQIALITLENRHADIKDLLAAQQQAQREMQEAMRSKNADYGLTPEQQAELQADETSEQIS